MFSFVPAPRTIQEAAFQARVMARASNLVQDGYHITWCRDMFPGDTWQADKAVVRNPQWESYFVCFGEGAESCECKAFEGNGYCKHVLGVLLENARLAAEAAAPQPAEAASHKRATSCDPFLGY